MRKVVFDIETRNFFEDVGKNDPALLDIALVGIYDSDTNTYTSYLEEELRNLWPILESADLLIGFNSEHFDVPLLNKYYPGDLTKIPHIDLMKKIKDVLGHRIALNNVTTATLGYGKTGHGLEVQQWFKDGELEKIKAYCLDDVRITKELYDHMRAYGTFSYRDGPSERTVNIDTRDWEENTGSALTHTLGF